MIRIVEQARIIVIGGLMLGIAVYAGSLIHHILALWG